jgi:hypothetical protein
MRTFRGMFLALAFALAGSATTTGCFSSQCAVCLASSTQPLDPDEYVITHAPVSAESNFTTIFGIPIQGYGDQVKRARDLAIAHGPGDALVNVSVAYRWTNYCGIVTVRKTIVTGNAVRIKSKNEK